MEKEPEDTTKMDRDSFEEYAWNKLEDALWYKVEEVLWNDQFDLEKEEYARLQQFTGYGPYTTAAVGVLTFIGLRGGRLFFARHRPVLASMFRSTKSSNNKTTSFPAGSSSSSTTSSLSPLPTQPLHTTPQPRSIPWTVFHAVVDLSISYLASIMVPVVLVDEDRVAAACIDMPLLPGPSSIADTFCPVVARQLAELHDQATSEAQRQALEQPHETSVYLRAALEFAANCDVRRRVKGGFPEEDEETGEEHWVDELTSDNERFEK